jgi:tryptophan-rich sensory protein
MKLNPWLALAAFLVICLAAGGLGGWATAGAVVDWYPTLNKPSWNPPAWIFGPVWTLLYVLMAIAAWLVWRKGTTGANVSWALRLFFVQLGLNTAWSFIFFGAHSPGLAFAEIIVLLAAILLATREFFRHSSAAGLLMLPYVAWVSFATILNFTIWRLN